MTLFGYAGQILRIDLTTQNISLLPTANYTDRFLGGRGIAAKIYWDETGPDTRALEPANCLVFITGPVAGFPRFAGCRWEICGKSAEMRPEAFSNANFGGSWGSWLKYAGYDGIAVIGKAAQPVYLLIDNGKAEIKEAAGLWGKTTIETEKILQSLYGPEARVLEIGPAAENMVTFSTILASEDSSGSSGFGAVMGSKNLKAIVVLAEPKKRPLAADPEKLNALAQEIYTLKTRNYENYAHESRPSGKVKACYGCINGCTRSYYKAEDNYQYKSFCQSSSVYMRPAMDFYGPGEKADDVSRLGNRLCDQYGLDTAVFSPLLDWLILCFEKGVLSEAETGLPFSRFGSQEFIEVLLHKISYREGFGDVLAEGALRAAEKIGRGAPQLVNEIIITRAGETRDYDPRLILANAMIYATEPRRAIQLLHASALPLKRWINWLEGTWKDALLTTEVMHNVAETFWGGIDSLDFSSYQGKALAAKKIQDYGYVKESLIMCDFTWPIYTVQPPDKSIGPGTLEARITSAITGRDLDENALLTIGERVFNLQRAIFLRQGWGGRQGDNLMGYLFEEPINWTFFDPELLVPDKTGQPVTMKGSILDRAGFEKIKDDYYQARGWDVASGLPTAAKLQSLDLTDIAEGLKKEKLMK